MRFSMQTLIMAAAADAYDFVSLASKEDTQHDFKIILIKNRTPKGEGMSIENKNTNEAMSAVMERLDAFQPRRRRSSRTLERPAMYDLEEFIDLHGINEEFFKAIGANQTRKRNFLILATACLYMHGYQYVCDIRRFGEYRDDRDRASKQYCGKHLDELAEVFDKEAGFQIPMHPEPGRKYAVNDCFTGNSAIYHFEIRPEVETFDHTHPAIREIVANVFLQVLQDAYPEMFEHDKASPA